MYVLDILVAYLNWWNVFVFLLTLVVCCVVAFLSYLHYIHGKYDHIPGPPRDSFITGNISLITKERLTSIFQHILLKLTKKYGKTYKIIFINTPIVVTSDPDAIKDLLVTGHHPKSKFVSTPFVSLWGERFMGNGLLPETDHKKWAFRRALMNPCFMKSYLRKLIPEFNVGADALMNKFAQKADGVTKFSLLHEFHHVTLDILGKVAFGLEINSLQTEDNEFTQAIYMSFKGLSVITKTATPFYILNPFNWKFIREVRQAVRLLRRFGKKILSDRIEAKHRGDYIPDDILTHIIKIKEENPEIDVEDIVDDFVTFFVAGQDTTANLLGSVVEFLGRYPEILNRLKEEIDEIIGEKSVLEYSDIDRLIYLDMVIKETLRLASPASLTFRELHKDQVIGGYKVPKGTIVAVGHYITARLEEFFKDPETFDPERFSPDAKERYNTYAYFPFTMGPRTCIGKHFADIEAKIILAKFIQRFDFELDTSEPLEFEDVLTLRPKGGVTCSVSMRGQ